MSLVESPLTDTQEPLLIAADELARLMQISRRTLWRLRSAGELPEPVRLGGTVRWRLEEVRDWVAMGCPRPQSSENGPPRR
jgi:excisionase family DNA binding protein